MNDHHDYQLRYEKLSFEDRLRKYRMEYVSDYLKKIPANRILEIGCGTDPIHLHFEGFEVLDLIEPGAYFFEYTEKMVRDDRRISIQNCFLDEAVLNHAGRYDVIIIGGFLHEIDDPATVLAGVRAISNTDTVVITYVPNSHSFHRLLAFEAGLISSVDEFSDNDKTFGRRNVYSLDAFEALFKQCGFSIEKIDTYFVKPFTHSQMNTLLEESFLNEELLKGLYGMGKYLPNFGCEIFLSAKINRDYQ